MRDMPPDIADFRVFTLPEDKETLLASAFSANDTASTEYLFSLLRWEEGNTSLLYSDRADRHARRKSFASFMSRPWQEVKISDSGGDMRALLEWMRGKRVFGCGNVAGLPLELLKRLIEERCEWTIPAA
jgi:hypothetical protein